MSSSSTGSATPGAAGGGRKVIAVCGASGSQGGSVARFLLFQQQFAVRALTRNPSSEVIQELKSLGAEIVVADFDEPETLVRAFKGAYGVFGVTSQEEIYEKCTTQGIAMVDAAKKNGVQHFIWSTFPSVVGGSVFMDPNISYTLFYPAVFYSSIFSQITHGSGHWKATYFVPLDTVFPTISQHDVGAWISHIFCNPNEWKGRAFKPCTQMMSLRQYSKSLEEFSGLPVITNDPTMEDFMGYEQVIPELWKGLKWYMEHATTFFDPKLGRATHPTAQGWLEHLDERLNGSSEPISPVVVKMDVNVDVHVD